MILAVSDPVHIRIRENKVLANVGETTSLLDERGGQAERVRLVVDQLGVHVVPQLYIVSGRSTPLHVKLCSRCTEKMGVSTFKTHCHVKPTYRVLHGSRAAPDEVTDIAEEAARLLGRLLELGRSLDLLDVLFEVL